MLSASVSINYFILCHLWPHHTGRISHCWLTILLANNIGDRQCWPTLSGTCQHAWYTVWRDWLRKCKNNSWDCQPAVMLANNVDLSAHVEWPLQTLQHWINLQLSTPKHLHYKDWIIPISIFLNNLEVFKSLKRFPCHWAGATTEVWRTRAVVLSTSIDLDETFHSARRPDVEMTRNWRCNSSQQQCAMTLQCDDYDDVAEKQNYYMMWWKM